jgi:hypothetical protein
VEEEEEDVAEEAEAAEAARADDVGARVCAARRPTRRSEAAARVAEEAEAAAATRADDVGHNEGAPPQDGTVAPPPHNADGEVDYGDAFTAPAGTALADTVDEGEEGEVAAFVRTLEEDTDTSSAGARTRGQVKRAIFAQAGEATGATAPEGSSGPNKKRRVSVM